jgi:TP901 family phage tail tape measure protein
MGGGDVVGTAIVNLKSDTSGFISDITSALSKGQGLFSNFGNDIAGSMKGAGGIMTAGITAPIVAGALFAVKSFETINTAETSLIRQTNSTGAAATQMKTSFTNVFGNTPDDATTVANVMAVVSDKLHIAGPALENVTKQGLDMSRMLGVDATGAVTGLSTAMNAFHMPASEAGNEMDKLYVISTKTGAPINDLTGTLAKAGSVAYSAKIPMDDYSAAIGSLAASGIPARQGNALLTDGVTKLQTQLGKQDVGNEWNAMMQRIATGTATASDKTLLGQKNYDKLSASLGNTTTGYNQLKAAQDSSAGSIEKQSEATMTLSEKLDEFKNKAEVAFAPFGKVLINVLENVLDAAKPILDILTSVMGVFSNMPAPVQMVVVAILGILAAIGPILMIIGPLATGFGVIAPIVSAIGVALMTTVLPAVLAILIPLLPIIIAVAAIGIALYLLYTYFKPFHDAVNEVAGWIKTLLGDLMSGNFGKLGDDFKKGILAGFSAITSFNWGGMAAKAWSALVSALGQFGTWLWGLISPLPMQLWTAYVGIWVQIGTWLWGLITTLPMKLWTAYIGIWIQIGTWLWGLISPLPMQLWTAYVGIWVQIGTWLWNLLSPIPGELWNGITTALVSFGTWLLGAAEGFFSGLPGGIQGAIGGLGDWMLSAAAGFFSGLTSAVSNAVGSITSAKLPAMAGGGLVTKPTVALIGEAGPELVVPLSGIRGGISAAAGAGALTSASATTNTAGGDIHVHPGAIQINNPQMNNPQDVENLADLISRKLAFKTESYSRRSGHARG